MHNLERLNHRLFPYPVVIFLRLGKCKWVAAHFVKHIPKFFHSIRKTILAFRIRSMSTLIVT